MVFSGDDAITLPIIGRGSGDHLGGVERNPRRDDANDRRCAAERWDTARRLFRKYLPLMQANFIESSPGPAKAVLAMMGRLKENYRLPLVPMKLENRAKLEKVATDVGLLQGRSVAH